MPITATKAAQHDEREQVERATRGADEERLDERRRRMMRPW